MQTAGSKRVILTVLLALPCLGELTWAAPEVTKAERRERLEQTDRNGDSSVDRSEFHARMVDVFFFSDADRDGSLDPAEFAATGSDPQRFSSADTDGNARSNLYEFIEYRFLVFEVIDTDDSGTLSESELLAATP